MPGTMLVNANTEIKNFGVPFGCEEKEEEEKEVGEEGQMASMAATVLLRTRQPVLAIRFITLQGLVPAQQVPPQP